MDDETRGYFEEIRRDLTGMRGEIGEFRGEVGALRREVGTLRDEVGTLRDAVGTLRDEVGTLRAELTQFREETDARFAGVDMRIVSEATLTRGEFGVIAEELQRRLGIVAETTLDNSRRLASVNTAIDHFRENVGLHLAEVRVAIADLRARR